MSGEKNKWSAILAKYKPIGVDGDDDDDDDAGLTGSRGARSRARGRGRGGRVSGSVSGRGSGRGRGRGRQPRGLSGCIRHHTVGVSRHTMHRSIKLIHEELVCNV